MHSNRHHLPAACALALAILAAAARAGSGPPLPESPVSEAVQTEPVPAQPAVQPAVQPTASAAVQPAQAAVAAARTPPVLPRVESKPDSSGQAAGDAPADPQRGGERYKPLGSPRAAASRESAAPVAATTPAPSGWVTQIASLAGVIGLIFVVGFAVKKFAPDSGLMGALGPRGKAPSGVLEVLGRYPTGKSGMLVIIKFDRRILLVNQSAGRGGFSMTTLTEITDPVEVASIITKTGGANSVSRQFERALKSVQGDAEAMPPKEAAPVKAVPARKQPQAVAPLTVPSPATKPAPKTADPFAELDGAAAAQTLRARLAAMQAAEAAATLPREFAA
jgi:hypothetical protein